MAARILVADDSATIRRLVRGILEYRGYEIVEASSGDEAHQVIEREAAALQLALLDLKMPGRDGLEVLESLRLREAQSGTGGPPLPVIILTAEEEEADRALAAGASRFLVKPFEPVLLLQIVKELIG
jgi:two-component system chemotaxis response regulator CheY